MKTAVALLLGIHGLICTLGFIKAFGLARLPQLSLPISRAFGVLWLLAGLGFLAGAVLLRAAPRAWWIPVVLAVLLSQVLIVLFWRDARAGTVINGLILIPVLLAMLDLRPSSLRSQYQAEVKQRLGAIPAAARVTEADLAGLPPLVQTYLRRVGVVGKPHVHSFRAIFQARMRSGPDAPWMAAQVEQVDFFAEPARLFWMEASRTGVPFHVFHRYVGDAASMQVRVLGLFEVLTVRGREITQSETVTLFNDICFFAPARLVDAPVTWQTIDRRRVRGTFSNAGHTISAVLEFDPDGDLVGFVSRDRYQSDGKTHRLLPWSTPGRAYRDFGGYRLSSGGEARWQERTGEWTYGVFELVSIVYNIDNPAETRVLRAAPRPQAAVRSVPSPP
jgi:hypothetical protein